MESVLRLGANPSITPVQLGKSLGRRFGDAGHGPFDWEAFSMVWAATGFTPDLIYEWSGLLPVEVEIMADGWVAVAGAKVHLTLDGRPIAANSRFWAGKGSQLSMISAQAGGATYIAATAGGDSLQPQRLQLEEETNEIDFIPYEPCNKLSAEKGVHSNRVGIRLQCAHLWNLKRTRSQPACLGMVQAPNLNELIVIGPDGPTTGGYPFVGVLPPYSISQLAKMPLGSRMELVPVSFEEADLKQKTWLHRLESHVRTLTNDENLIVRWRRAIHESY